MLFTTICLMINILPLHISLSCILHKYIFIFIVFISFSVNVNQNEIINTIHLLDFVPNYYYISQTFREDIEFTKKSNNFCETVFQFRGKTKLKIKTFSETSIDCYLFRYTRIETEIRLKIFKISE